MVRAFTERHDHPDFIIITAARDVATVRAAMQVGAVYYLVKPFGFQALHDRLVSYRDLRARMAGSATRRTSRRSTRCSACSAAPRPCRPSSRRERATRLRLSNWYATPSRSRGDISAAEVAEAIGVSRATAQRYLTYLARHGVVRLNSATAPRAAPNTAIPWRCNSGLPMLRGILPHQRFRPRRPRRLSLYFRKECGPRPRPRVAR